MIRVLLVDDHASFRQPLAFMMSREPEITVVAQAGTVAEARQVLEGVDVAVVDLDLPDGCGLDLVPPLQSANPNGAVLVLTASAAPGDAARAVEIGVAGILHKSAGIAEIIQAVRKLAAGEHLLAVSEAVELLRHAARQREESREARRLLEQLTPREMEVLKVLAEGLSDKEIAERLHVRTETVRTHMVNILSKLEVQSRLQAVIFAFRQGLVEV